MTNQAGTVTSLCALADALDMSQPVPFALLHNDENITIVLYKPQSPDAQEPHDQDEYYFVASGTASICIDDKLTALQTGDAIFVPAKIVHGFEDASPDFSCWALFYGERK